MAVRTIDSGEMRRQLLALGVPPGGVLVVHTAFSQVKPVAGGPRGLIEALLTALGPAGTLVMPSMSDADDQPFDPSQTPCRGLGVVADTFWRLPGVRRSDNPHAFAAMGPQAAAITAPHPVDVPHGLESPIGRIYALDGHILLLGVGHEANTTIHLAEVLAGVRYRRPKHVTLLRGGQLARFDYDEIDHCCQNFQRLDQWLEAEGRQRRGRVGQAEARLVRSRDVVAAALAHLREDETVFLHAAGMCGECDEARASLTVRSTAASSRQKLCPDEKQDLRAEAAEVVADSDRWLERPHELLGGRKPADFIGTADEPLLRDLLRALKHGMTT
jgi:aminoglycoside N3'-acetyltransferase